MTDTWRDWDLVVTVGGIDVSAQLTGAVSIDAERNAARTADFTVILAGSIDVLSWTGKAVTVDYVSSDNVTTRRFTGVIVEPVLDIASKTLHCTCADDLQRIVDGHTNAALLALVPGAKWSKHVFDETATGWDYLQDLLATVSQSVELSTAGTLQVHSLQNKPVPDFSIDRVLDESLRVALVERSTLINRVDVTFSARFERLYHRVDHLTWDWPLLFCESWFYGIKAMNKAIVREAAKDAGWSITAETYDSHWPTGWYSCPSYGYPDVAYNNFAPDALINGFDIDVAFRWQQSVTHDFTISVTAPDSIAAYGELKDSLESAADFASAVENWGADGTDFTTLPTGFAYGTEQDRYRDEYAGAELAAALDAIIAQAVETIAAAHRSNKVSFRLPINPAIDLSHTIAVTDSNVSAKGIVNRLSDVFEFETGKVETEIELLLSSGHSGLDTVTTAYTVPAATVPTPEPGYNRIRTVPSYIGKSFDSVPYDPALWGWFVNRAQAEQIANTVPDPIIIYNEKLELKFDAIATAKTENTTETQVVSIEIDVPHNTLILVA